MPNLIYGGAILALALTLAACGSLRNGGGMIGGRAEPGGHILAVPHDGTPYVIGGRP
jgi:hypothetical protein